MEQACYTKINTSRETSYNERKLRKDYERNILQMRAQPDQEQLYSKILEKSIYEKARDRMNRNKKADDEQE